MTSNVNLQFTLDHDRWTTTAVLPSWSGFQDRSGAYGAQSSDRPSDGEVEFLFAPEGGGAEPLSASEISAVQWVIENEASISEALILSLLDKYPAIQEKYASFALQEDELMPDIKSANDLRALIGLSSVNIHQVQKDGIPYAGFEFGCAWDEEHGLGVLMHGTRTVRIGGADTAILLWMAEEDGGEPYA